jgi:hypothetical protein
MINRRTFAAAAGLALCAAAGLAAPQDPAPTPTPATSPGPSRPPLVDIHPAKPPAPKTKLDRYKGRVLVFNMAQIMVQSADNEKMVWSFQYSPELRQQVGDMLNRGGYQYGDSVQVFCNPGTTVAVRLKGKHLKSS